MERTTQTSGTEAKRPISASVWSDRFREAQNFERLDRQGPSLAVDLDRRFDALAKSLKAFEWPGQTSPLSGARLVVRDPNLADRVEASLASADKAQPYYRYFSRGFDASAPTTLDPGTYTFDVTQSGTTKSLSVDVSAGMTNGDVLSAVETAVNGATLPVQATVVRQNTPNLAAPGCLATGSALALAVNGAYADQGLTLADTSGHLLQSLALAAVARPMDPATLAEYDVQGGQTYRPSTYSSLSFDPNATTTLAAGTYTFDWTLGNSSGSLSLLVQATDTWRDVLNNLAFATSGGEGLLAAQVVDQDRPSDLTGDTLYLMMQGKAVVIAAAAPKVGERLVLSGADAASTSALSTLKLNATAQPGSDGHLTVNGAEEIRAPGVFSEDQGRLLLTLSDSFSETLPLKVVEAVDQLSTRLSDITTAYNDLRSLILPNENILRAGAAELWRNPLAAKAADYKQLGLKEWGKDRLLWFGHDDFFRALGADPAAVEDLLLHPDTGLFSAWSRTTQDAQKNGGASFLVPATSLPDPLAIDPTPRTEFELQKGNQLLDLYDAKTFEESLPALPWEPKPIVSKKG